MTTYTLRRVLGIVPVLLGVTFLVFAINRIIPSNPAVAILGDKGTPEAQQQLAEELGLNRPVFLDVEGFRATGRVGQLFQSQYVSYMSDLLTGNLGRSFISRTPVSQSLKVRFPATMELAFFAIVIGGVLGIVLGVLAALNRGSWIDTSMLFIAVSGVSFPVFWTAIILIYLFSVNLGWFPPSGRLAVTATLEPVTGLYVLDSLLRGQFQLFGSALLHLVLPAFALGTHTMALIMRMTRSSMLDVLRRDYVRTAMSKGLPPLAVVAKHTFRNALLPIVTVVGLSFGNLLSGAILIEAIFNWPGIGSWIYSAITLRDYPVIQGGILFVAAVFVVLNLLVDLSYALIDPRIRYS
ncbi:MAG TPA: ABC transporter permease [Trueperaceae bacterium]|nr:ABC transporter permease [Trueperaceae bacterium]